MEEDGKPESVEDLVSEDLGSLHVHRVEATSSPDLVTWTANGARDEVSEMLSDAFTDHGDGLVSYRLSSGVEYAPGCRLRFESRQHMGRDFLERCVKFADQLISGFPPPTFSAEEMDAIARNPDTEIVHDVYCRVTETILAYKLQLKNYHLNKKIQQQQQLIKHLQARIVDAKEGRRL